MIMGEKQKAEYEKAYYDQFGENRFCALYHRYGIQGKEYFSTKELAIDFLMSGYNNDECFPNAVIDESIMAIVWNFDIVEL